MSTVAVPYNLQKQDARAPAIEQAVDYALQVARGYERLMSQYPFETPARPTPLSGRCIIDVGPGPTLGAVVLLACAGARVAVADRHLVSWDPDFHPAFYARLLQRLEDRDEAYLEPLRRIVKSGGFDPSVLTMLNVSAERLGETCLSYEVVFSNATLEHVEDMPTAARSLFAVTHPGGIGFHQVDFRDHHNFKDPLRYLTLDQKQFETLRDGPEGNFGTRLRLCDYVRCFENAGFVIRWIDPNEFADPAYVASIRPLFAHDLPHYSDEELTVTGALLCVERPAR